MNDVIPQSSVEVIENIIEKAHIDGRKTLFEHEVYFVLEEMGMHTPPHILVHEASNISNSTLAIFNSEKVVLKIVSKEITHKRDAGGVRIIYKDLNFIKYTFNQMIKEFDEKGVPVEGILLVDFINYSQELGNENLLGFRESEAFGPVISFSKGGIDAEHFAKNFSLPNLILSPIDRRWAQALLESTKIQDKYISEGKTDYILKIVDAGIKLSALSTSFSNYFKKDTQFTIKEFEINPFVFTPEDDFIAIDGFASFDLKEKDQIIPDIQSKKSLTSFFKPNGIAIVGISANDKTKSGNIIAKNIVNMKRDDLYCINKNGGTIKINGRSYPLDKSLMDVGRPIDLVIISVPAEQTVSIVEECAQKKVKAIVLIPGGFSEIQKNVEIEEKILAICRAHDIRIIGPNCLGIVYAGDKNNQGINTFFVPEEKFHINDRNNSDVAILSQSGALGITEIYNLRNAISPMVVVSYGNQLDVDPGDLINYFEDDPSVNVIGCYIEGFKKGAGRKFFNCASKIKKPIIVYKAGRTAAGRKATESHTASIAGEYEVAKAAMKQAGLIVADTMIDHGDFIKTFALLKDFNVTGNRVAIIANAGYEKTYAADNLGNLVLSSFDSKTMETLTQLLPSYVKADPLLDLTAMASDEMFEKCIETVLKSSSVDGLFISIVPYSADIHTTDDEIDRENENIAARIVRIVHKYKKPAVVSVNVVSGSDAVYNKIGQILDSGGVPTFLTARRAMICLNEFIRYSLAKESNDFSEWLK